MNKAFRNEFGLQKVAKRKNSKGTKKLEQFVLNQFTRLLSNSHVLLPVFVAE
jgi:hypothetical protein